MHNRNASSAASVFLLLLLLIPVSPKCRKGTTDECRKASPVPGSQYAGMGIDIHTLTMTRLYQEISKPGECTLCENPLLEGKPLQRLPLVITDWEANISCPRVTYSTIHQSPISVAQALADLQVRNPMGTLQNVKLSPSDKVQMAVVGSRSKMTQECIRMSSQDKYNFILLDMRCSFYKFRVKESMLFSDNFKNTLNNLPEKYNHSSKDEYFQIIRTFGTHWIKEYDLGAYVRYLIYISVCEALLESVSLSLLIHCMSLDMFISFGLNVTTYSKASFQECKEIMKTYNLLLSGSHIETGGGRVFYTEKEWLESAKSWPGLLSSSPVSLYSLVPLANPRRESLLLAQSDYERENTLWRNCSKPCPPGSQPSDDKFCSCQCPNNNFTDSTCCPATRGVGKLMVTIERAVGLWGDFFTHSDGYVSVSVNRRSSRKCTHTVWNNNNPTWNAILDFGIIELDKYFNYLQVEVWDEDRGWNDDRLGWCYPDLVPGIHESLTCDLKHGKIHFKYHLECGHNLLGSSCWDYSSHWPYTETNPDYYHY